MPSIVNNITTSRYKGVHAMHTKEKHTETECGNGQEM